MIRFHRISAITVFLLIRLYCIGQGYENPDKSLIPPSPTASELGKYGSFPISYYTGTPNIIIPLYEMNAGKLKLPISLTYHASGIRVDDIASWVGLGWSLNAGGVITITTVGKSDFLEIPDNEEQNVRYEPMNYSDISSNNLNFTKEELHTMSSSETNNGDTESDIYNYNFAGFKGQFLINANDEICFLSNNNGLTFNVDRINKKFEAKDNLGNIYIFEDYETTDNTLIDYGLSGNAFLPHIPHLSDYPTITSFFLSRILSYDYQDIINFEYETDEIRYFTRITGFIETRSTPYNCGGLEHCALLSCQSQSINYEYNYLYYNEWDLIPESATFNRSYVVIDSKRLKSIEHNRSSTSILFNSESRNDIIGSRRLANIEIRYRESREFLWNFYNNNYFNSNIIKIEEDVNSYHTGNPLDKRLRLDGIRMYGKDNTITHEPFSFSYYGDENVNLRLPYRNCYAGVDSWGYCNDNPTVENANNALKSFPNNQIVIRETNPDLSTDGIGFLNDNYTSPPIFEQGGNLLPNGNFVMANSLNKITYPTKGTTTFEYELNTYSQILNSTVAENTPAGGQRIKKIIEDAGDNTVPVIREFTYSGGVVFNLPDYATQGYVKNLSIYKTNCFKIFNSPMNSLNAYGNILGYKSVNELVQNGKTTYDYITVNDEPGNGIINGFARIDPAYECNSITETNIASYVFSSNIYPRVRQFDNGHYGKSYRWGLLKKIETQNISGEPIKIELSVYDFYDGPKVFGNKVYRKRAACIMPNPPPAAGCTMSPVTEYFLLNVYHHQTGKSFLKTKNITIFDESGDSPITTIVAPEFDPIYELPKKVTETGTDIIVTEYSYPFEFYNSIYPGNVYRQMLDNHMINYPIEIRKKKNGKVIEASTIDYHRFSSSPQIIRQREVLSLENVTGLTDFNPIQWDNSAGDFMKDSRYKSSVVFNSYDNTGRLTQFTPTNNAPQSYIWSPTGSQYPNAKVINSTSDRIAYTSFEEGPTTSGVSFGNWRIVTGPTWSFSNIAKIGKYALQTTSGGSPIETINLIPPGKYKISCWYRYSAGTVDFPSGTEFTIEYNGNWAYKEGVLQINSSQKLTVLVNNGTIDELRLYPVDASIQTYCYDENRNMLGSFDTNGFGFKYEYDNAGRLILIRDHEDKILKRYEYNYAH